jgi:hypothetical protein
MRVTGSVWKPAHDLYSEWSWHKLPADTGKLCTRNLEVRFIAPLTDYCLANLSDVDEKPESRVR